MTAEPGIEIPEGVLTWAGGPDRECGERFGPVTAIDERGDRWHVSDVAVDSVEEPGEPELTEYGGKTLSFRRAP